MKTLRILSLLLIAGVLFSCQKDVEPVDDLVEVSFGITKVDPILQKDGAQDPDIPQCSDLEPSYAKITINGYNEPFKVQVFYLGDTLYTQAIKLPVTDEVSKQKVYTVTDFLIYSEDGTLVMAVPAAGSDYANYVAKTVAFNFTVQSFIKNAFDIEVLCFEPKFYTHFGFTWFEIGEVVARNICFFGDICVKNWETYAGSLYENDPNGGLQLDMSAIMRIIVTWPNEHQEAFFNVIEGTDSDTYLTNEPLCITYPDRVLIPGETFTIELDVLLNQGEGFDYETIATYTVTDDGLLKQNDIEIDPGTDNIYDFVIGTCNAQDADMVFAPWQALPPTAVVYISHNNYATGGYWDMTVNDTDLDPATTNYDFPPHGTNFIGWCGDPDVTIVNNSQYTFHLYSSLSDSKWSQWLLDNLSLDNLAKINWLFNNLDDYGYPALSGMFVTPWDPDTYSGTSADLQQAVWDILYNVASTDPMVTDANLNADFSPLPGEFAAVLMIANDNPEDFQLIFTMVDP